MVAYGHLLISPFFPSEHTHPLFRKGVISQRFSLLITIARHQIPLDLHSHIRQKVRFFQQFCEEPVVLVGSPISGMVHSSLLVEQLVALLTTDLLKYSASVRGHD